MKTTTANAPKRIVDDHPDILEGLSYVLKDYYEVTTAGNLTEAKKEVSTTVFDVICSDYAMPDGTGLELLEFCRQEKFTMLFILMSAILFHTLTENKSGCREMGIS